MTARSGLQSERTTMAWQRTALGLGAVSALLLHRAGGDVVTSAPGVAGLLAALAVLVRAETRHGRRGAAGAQSQPGPMGARAVRALAAVTVLLSLAAAIVALNPGG